MLPLRPDKTGDAMAQAYGLLLAGDGTGALHCICRDLQQRYAGALARGDRDESLRCTLEGLIRSWPCPDVLLRIRDGRLLVCFHKPVYSTREAAGLWRHCQRHLMAGESSVCGWPGALASWLMPRLEALLEYLWADRHGAERARLIRALVSLRARVMRALPHWQARAALLSGRLSVFLHEPDSRCRELLQRHVAHCGLINHRRLRRGSAAQLARRRQAIRWHDAPSLDRAEQSPASLLIVTFHFGDYPCLPGLISRRGPPERRLVLLLHQEQEFAVRRNRLVESRGEDLRPLEVFLNHDNDPLALVGLLRGGNTSLILFCDLPRRHGRTVPVVLLGRQAFFSSAAAEIALLARVPILTLITFDDGHLTRVCVPAEFAGELLAGESRHDAVLRLTQNLAGVLEPFLQRFAPQWYFLPELPNYFLPEQGLDPLAG